MANLVYNWPSDQIAGSPAPTLVTGTAAAGYALTNLYDGRPDLPFKLTTTGPFRVVWDRGSAQTPGLVALLSHNFAPALDVRWQMHTANTWATPDIDLAITIPAAREDGWPINPWIDTSAQVAKRYWSLYVPANTVIPSLGEIWIASSKRTLLENIEDGAQPLEERPTQGDESDALVTFVYDQGVTKRSLAGEISAGMTTAGRNAAWAWWRAAKGKALPFLIVPDPDVNEAMLVRHAASMVIVPIFLNNYRASFLFTEESGGLP